MCSRKWLIVALVAGALASACSDYNTNLSIQTSSSTLTFVSPSSVTQGSQGFTITANGTGFTTGALILWNGTPLTTTLVSSIQLTAPVPSSDLANAGTVQIAVQIPGSAQSATQNVNNTTTTEISNIVLFTVSPPAGTPPALTSLSASTTLATSTPYCSASGFTLTVNGTNFTSDAKVNWNGVPQATTFASATQLTTSISPAQAAFPGTVAVTVTNSVGTSASKPFTLSTPAAALVSPTVSSLSQTSAPAGNPALTLTITGTNLLPCSTVQWVNGSNVTSSLTTAYVSATQLTATVPASDFLTAGTTQVNVLTIGPGGGTSGNTPFTVLPPTVTSVSSSAGSTGSTPACSTSGVIITVTGTNFVNGSVVDWIVALSPPPPPPQPQTRTVPLATAFVSSTQLTATVPAAYIASVNTVSIGVSNLGVSSNATPFTISASSPPAATIASVSPVNATAGTAAFTLTVTGTNFVPCSNVQWTDASSNVTQLATSYVSSTQLTATVPPANLNMVQTAQIAVANPAGSTNISNAVALPIVLPTISSLSASSTSANTTPECSPSGITLTVNGTNFVANGLTVNWNGSPRPTTFVSATQLTAAISAVDTAFSGPVSVTVSSATIPSLASASSTFTITPSTTPLPMPTISQLTPSSVAAKSPAFALDVTSTGSTGSTLVPCSVVLWNGTPLTTTFNSPAGITAAIPAADVTAPASIPVTVSTLKDGGGGGTSNALTFTVFTPTAAHIASSAQPASSIATEVTSSNSTLPSLSTATMSADQRYIVTVLASTDGVTEIPESTKNVFVRDTCTGAPSGCQPSVTLASVGFNGNPADGDSISPSISADGRYVTFVSSAMNLVSSDTNGVADVFVRDTCAEAASSCTPSTQRVSVASDGTQANAASTAATISPDGRYVTFVSTATNLGASALSSEEIFLRDTCAGSASACTPTTQQVQ